MRHDHHDERCDQVQREQRGQGPGKEEQREPREDHGAQTRGLAPERDPLGVPVRLPLGVDALGYGVGGRLTVEGGRPGSCEAGQGLGQRGPEREANLSLTDGDEAARVQPLLEHGGDGLLRLDVELADVGGHKVEVMDVEVMAGASTPDAELTAVGLDIRLGGRGGLAPNQPRGHRRGDPEAAVRPEGREVYARAASAPGPGAQPDAREGRGILAIEDLAKDRQGR